MNPLLWCTMIRVVWVPPNWCRRHSWCKTIAGTKGQKNDINNKNNKLVWRCCIVTCPVSCTPRRSRDLGWLTQIQIDLKMAINMHCRPIFIGEARYTFWRHNRSRSETLHVPGWGMVECSTFNLKRCRENNLFLKKMFCNFKIFYLTIIHRSESE